MSTSHDRYRELRYPGLPYPFTHPDRLATIAALRGLTSPDVETARVLELGCGDGLNLLAMAYQLPSASLVGVDACAEPLRRSREAADGIGLTNLELRAADFDALGDELGGFDYVIAHGVLSWVPGPTRNTLMEVIARALSPDGVAVVSYNALPGYYFRHIAREIMRVDEGLCRTPEEQIHAGRARLATFAQTLAHQAGTYGTVLDELARYVEPLPDAYVFHDALSDTCDAFYFREFAAMLRRVGLDYVGEACYRDSMLGGYPPAFQAMLAACGDRWAEREHLVDLMRNSLFRRAVLCRSGRAIDWTPQTAYLQPMHIVMLGTTIGSEHGAVTYESPDGGRVTIAGAGIQAALGALSQRTPATMSYAEFLAVAVAASTTTLDLEELTALVLQLYGAGLVDLLPRARCGGGAAGHRPQASRLARWQLASGASAVVNASHQSVTLGPVEQLLIRTCDGTRTHPQLVEAVLDAARAGTFVIRVDDVPTTDPSAQRRAVEGGLAERLARLGQFGLFEIETRSPLAE